MTSYSKSLLFSIYNRARAAANRGEFALAKVNSAFGMHQRKDCGERPYRTTVRSCNCPDSTIRKQVCKHRIFKMIKVRMQEAA